MLLLAFLLAVQQPVAAASGPVFPGTESPNIEIPRLEAPIEVDGRLDEPVWDEAARLTGFSQYEPVDGRPAAEHTDVLVWYSADAIHFGIIAHDRHPEAIRATVADRDNIGDDDHVTIYLDTFDDRRRAFFFAVNPLGIQEDGVRTEGSGRDRNPDFHFESVGRLTGEGYVVEVRIPFRSLRLPGREPQSWGLQVERRVQRTGYTDTWTPVRRASASFLAQSGTLERLTGLERGVVLETQPFMTLAANGEARSTGFQRESLNPDAGVNLHVGLSNLSIDATINPDFSQVEADVGQVTANERFALSYPEKRPFFLEGIELFDTPSRLVYTRQIAEPKVGGKVSGKAGDLGIAYMTAFEDADGDDALFNIVRLRRDYGGSSLAGVTYTDRSVLGGESGDYNRVLAADVRHVFGGMYYAAAQLGRAWTREGLDEPGNTPTESNAPIWRLEVDRTGHQFGFNYTLNGVGRDFITRSGFVNRNDIIEARALNRVTFYGGQDAFVERVTTMFFAGRNWRHQSIRIDEALEGDASMNTTVRMRGGWELSVNARRDFFVLDPADYAGLTTGDEDHRIAYRPLERVSGPTLELSANTPAFRRLNASGSIQRSRTAIFAEGSEGDVASANATLSLRPHESVRLSLSHDYQRITRTRDGSAYARTMIPRVRMEIQPTRVFFFRAITEYRSERAAAPLDARSGEPLYQGTEALSDYNENGLRVDLLASYQPSPGTAAFFGYGSSLRSERAFRLGRLERQSDGFFLKLAYRFRQ